MGTSTREVTMAKNKNVGKPRNYKLESGVYRFGKSATYRKKAIYKFTKKVAKKAAPAKKPIFVEKKVGGAKNGETRMVRVKKLANDYPTQDAAPKGTSVNFFSKHVRKVRASLAPGAIAIVLAGPHKLNGCPLRRINQRYLLATSAKVDLAGVAVPENVNDKYFARVKAEKAAKKEGDIFDAKKEAYKPSEQRKKNQVTVDTQVLEAIKEHGDGKVLKQYLRASFALSKGQYPHNMAF